MTVSVAGIDPHQDQFTVGIVDNNGVETTAETFPNTTAGFVDAIDLLATHRVVMVGVEGSASWGAHVAIALVAAGFDAREVPAQRSATQRRARRLAKTDIVDSLSVARALLAEPTLGPVQALDVYDPLVAKIEAVLEHRRALVETRTLMLHYAADQIVKLPIEIRDQLESKGKIESRLRRLESIDTNLVSTIAGEYRLSWLLPLIDQDRQARREIRRLERLLDDLLDQHGTTLRDEPGIGPIAAATLLCEVGDPFRFARESKFARWCGTGAVALSSGEGHGEPVKHRLDFRGNRRINSVLYIASVTQQRDRQDAQTFIDRKTREGKTRREARRAHKRHLANRVIRRMWKDEKARTTPTTAAA
ncbi:MAG: IS110 family transposase [Alphaproteobacteria bacterium]|nr:IS110 family transposase [Alphaproteobacteria bacterium]MCP5033081.1 IS110 family transposase [Actinomycetes bacterium]